MDFTLSKEHEMARSLFKEFAEKEVKPLAQEVDETEAFPRETVEKMAKLADTHLLLLRTEGKAGCSLLHDKGGDLLGQSAALLNRACDRKDNIYVSFLTVGDKAHWTADVSVSLPRHWVWQKAH